MAPSSNHFSFMKNGKILAVDADGFQPSILGHYMF